MLYEDCICKLVHIHKVQIGNYLYFQILILYLKRSLWFGTNVCIMNMILVWRNISTLIFFFIAIRFGRLET